MWVQIELWDICRLGPHLSHNFRSRHLFKFFANKGQLLQFVTNEGFLAKLTWPAKFVLIFIKIMKMPLL